MLVQRICVLDGASYELAYVGAVEKLAGIQVPKRSKYLRVIQAELSRIQSHLLNLGLLCYSMGLDTMKMISWGDRERILKILDEMTGARIYNIYNILGGVRNDLPRDFKKSIEKIADYMQNRLRTYDELTFENSTFIERTKKIGKITKEMAQEYDITGPNLRASGIDFDIRKAMPYEAYEELYFKIPRFMEGDVYHRALCRRIEIEESLGLIKQALSKLPRGKIKETRIKDGTKVGPFNSIPEGESIYCIESARGELCFHMVSDGSNKPYRAKIRGPTFDPILVLLPVISKGINIADAPVIYWSLDNCPADHDR
jgi:NADH:ubiquinone oxidoreductase subunit D